MISQVIFMDIINLSVGQHVFLKKPHPCGSYEFRIMRLGSDVRILCEGCGRDMTISREKLDRAIKKTL
jgi:hypothetical protein